MTPSKKDLRTCFAGCPTKFMTMFIDMSDAFLPGSHAEGYVEVHVVCQVLCHE